MTLSDTALDCLLADSGYQTTSYRFRSSFRRNGGGNYVTTWDRKLVTVFVYGDGQYGWCIRNLERLKDGPKWCPRRYATNEDAMAGAWDELTRGLVR